MKKNLIRLLKHVVLLVAGGACIGTLLLVLVYCLPTSAIKRHVAVSYDNLIRQEEDLPEQGFARYLWKNKETFTDAIMMQYAFEKIPGKCAFEHAMWAYHNDFSNTSGWRPEESLKAILDGEDTSGMYLREYSRYWHGYLVYLKPLLLVFSWGQILVLGTALQLGLMAAVCVMAYRRRQLGVAVAMFVGGVFMKLALVMASVDMSVCWWITLVALIVMLGKQDWLEEKKYYPEFFLCVGMLTSFFDFLTYPVVTLGFPLCAYFLVKPARQREDSGKNEKSSWVSEDLKRLVGYSCMWGIGYAGMWACKWVIADLTLRTGTIKNALWTVLGITSGISGHGGIARIYGGFHAINLNLQEYDSIVYPVLAVLLAAGVAVSLVRAVLGRVPAKELLETTVLYLVIAVIPFAWIMAAQFHSALHARFTFRIISITAMAACGLILTLWRKAAEE